MNVIVEFGQNLIVFWQDMADFINTPILSYEGFTVSLGGLFVSGLVFAILSYKIVKFLIP